MWAIIKNEKIDQIILGNKGVDINGTQHSKAIFSLWSKEELRSIGIIPYSIQKNGDTRFQIEGGVINSISSDGTEAIGITQYTDKPLEDVLQYDAEGKAIIDEETGTQAKITGLKTYYKNLSQTNAYNILEHTDWYVVKHTELGTSISSDIKEHRAAVRTKANELETKINNCVSVGDLKILVEPTIDSEGSTTDDAEMYNWPKVPSTIVKDNKQTILKIIDKLVEIPVTVTTTVTTTVTVTVTASTSSS